MNLILLFILALIAPPLLVWFIISDIIRIRRDLAEIRYYKSAVKRLCCTECAWEDKV